MYLFPKPILVLYCCFSLMLANAQGYLSPVSELEFQQRYQQIAARKTDEYKFQAFQTFSNGKSFTAQQVKQVATLFQNDYWRYQFAVSAYNITSDKQNFYDVYDAFVSYSAVFRLHDFLNQVPAQPVQPVPVTPVPVPNSGVVFPTSNNYNGKRGCQLPLADSDFDYYAVNVFSQLNDGLRIKAAKQLMSQNCISMAQLMKIVVSFNLETSRLTFLKEAFLSVYDLENYTYAAMVFTSESYKNEWLAYAKATLYPPVVPVPPVVVCEVTPADFEEIKATIKKQGFSSTQLSIAKQVLQSKKCFSTAQIKQMMQLFSFEESKLELAKFAWDYTTDRANYYTLADAFSFSDSKEDLMSFIEAKR